MSIFTVYAPPGVETGDNHRTDEMVFIRDEFSRAGLVLGPFWLAFTRQWWGLAAYAAAGLAMAGVVAVLGVSAAVWSYLYLGLNVIFAHEAPEIRGRVLEARGWKNLGVSEGRTEDEAAYRFLSHWLKDKPKDQPAVAAGPSSIGEIRNPMPGDVLRTRGSGRPPRLLN